MEEKCKQCGKTVSEVGPIDDELCWDCWWHLMEKLHMDDQKIRDKQQKKEV